MAWQAIVSAIPQILETIANDVQAGIAFFSPGANTQLSKNPMSISSRTDAINQIAREIDKQGAGQQNPQQFQAQPQDQGQGQNAIDPEEAQMLEDRLIRALSQQQQDFSNDPYVKARWLNGMVA